MRIKSSIILRLIIIYISIFDITCLSAQTKFKGKITETDSTKIIPYVNILLKEKKSSKIISFTHSDSNGLYMLSSFLAGKYYLTFSSLGYKTHTESIVIDTIEKTILKNIVLKEEVYVLNEVIVQAELPISIKKDTISYKTKYYVKGNEQTVEDYATAGDHKEGMIRVSGVHWFTNLDTKKRHEKLILYKQYSSEEYPTYDNYNAINIDKTKDIPVNYNGFMGVPITFLNKYNPEQFEIIGQGQGNLYRELTPKGLSQKFVDDYYRAGGKGSIKEDHPVLAYYNNDGNPVIPYMRIIIKNITL